MFPNHVLVLLRSVHAVHFEDVYTHYSTDQSIDPSTNQWSKLLSLKAVLEWVEVDAKPYQCVQHQENRCWLQTSLFPLSPSVLFKPWTLNFELWTQCMVSCIWLSVHLQPSSLLLLLSPVNSLTLPWLSSLSYNLSPPPLLDHHTHIHTHTRCRGDFEPTSCVNQW